MRTEIAGGGLHGRGLSGLVADREETVHPEGGQPQLFSRVTELAPGRIDPLGLFELADRQGEARAFWSKPSLGIALVGVGEAWSITVRGAARFRDARQAWNTCVSEAQVEGQPATEPVPTGPVALGGFSFDPLRPASGCWQGFPDGRLVLPRMMLTLEGGRAWLTQNAVLDGDEDARSAAWEPIPAVAPPADRPGAMTAHDLLPLAEPVSAGRWKAAVAAVQREFRPEGLRKVVLAREARTQAGPFEPTAALAALSHSYPGCTVFAFGAGQRCFLGASPEQLVRLQDRRVQTAALASTAARGDTEQEDRLLAEALLASSKERIEHEIVARGMWESLAAAGVYLPAPAAPSVIKLPNLQHLYTPFDGHAPVGVSVLDIVAKLHPTPAMGGYPREEALEAIRRYEGLDRGWYAAPVGWIDAQGEGEFAVGIRSALLDEEGASLFGGCGIVAGSDPEREYAESCLKLRPMLGALVGARR